MRRLRSGVMTDLTFKCAVRSQKGPHNSRNMELRSRCFRGHKSKCGWGMSRRDSLLCLSEPGRSVDEITGERYMLKDTFYTRVTTQR